MEISLGNFVAFLYCLENSSKFVEVGNLNIYGSSETDKLRIDLVISCFGKNKEFKDQVLSVLPVDTKIIESQNRVLVSFPAVEKDRSKAKKEGDFELVKYGGWSASVRSIFNPPVDLKCPEITPADLRLEAIVGDIVAFSTGGTTYFAKKGQNLRSKIGQPIAGYSSLKLLDIKEEEKKVVLQNTAGLADNADCASIRNFGMK
ncbi:MAG: hypothetical protein WCI43_00660 [Candidatus Firestonebacteria bacterium]